jgi:hypothetical protein
MTKPAEPTTFFAIFDSTRTGEAYTPITYGALRAAGGQALHAATGQLGKGAYSPEIRRRAQDDIPPRKVVTAAYFGDPKPSRAGRAPDCEDSRLDQAQEDIARKLRRLGVTRESGYVRLDVANARVDALRAKRFTPKLP